MQPRFVIVPAVPVEKEAILFESRFYAVTVPGGFDSHDNQKKLRLEPSYLTKTLAEAARARLSSECRNPDELFPILRGNAPAFKETVEVVASFATPLAHLPVVDAVSGPGRIMSRTERDSRIRSGSRRSSITIRPASKPSTPS